MKLDDLTFPIDSYEIKARIAPALLISLPVLFTMWTCYNAAFSTLSDLFKGTLSIVVIYGFSIVVRALGKRIEPQLWTAWGGKPSTQIVSWRNTIIGDDLKALYLQAVRNDLKLPTPSKENEAADPVKAADLFGQAFKRIQGVIRQKDKDGLWSIANADYGFARNLLGSRILWLVISLTMTAVSAINLYIKIDTTPLVGMVLNILMDILVIYIGWFILPNYTKRVAFRYAEHAWESFYNVSQK